MERCDALTESAGHAFQARLEAYGIVCSMSRKGTCRDSAPTESFFNSLKNGRMSGCHAPATEGVLP